MLTFFVRFMITTFAIIWHNLKKKGYTFNQCLCELIANSIDANCHNCLITIDKDNIKIIDDGQGMDIEGLNNMWDLNRESHRDEEKIGLCGVGAKASLLLLSKKTYCIVYTKNKDSTYLKAIINWDKIFEIKKLSGMIEFEDMNKNEIEKFNKERNVNKVGTKIVIPYDEEIEDVINNQFNLENSVKINPKERFGVIFGYVSHFKLKLKHIDYPEEIKHINYYSPFLRTNINFYQGKIEYEISVVMNSEGEINYYTNNPENEQLIYCKKTGRGVDTKTTRYIKDNRDLYLGEFRLIIGMHKDINYFNPENPKEITDTNTTLRRFFWR